MTKTPFKDYTPRTHGRRNIDEALAEVQREMDVRKRLFDRWVAEGRMSWVDAHDRLERHMSALHLLIQYSKALDAEHANNTNPLTVVAESEAISALDIDRVEQAA